MSSRRKVLFVQPWIHSGGPDVFVRHLTRSLSREGFDFLVAVPAGRPALEPLRSFASVHEIEGLDMVPKTRSPVSLSRHANRVLRSARALQGLIRSHHIGIVHSGSVLCWAGGVAARLCEIPHVYHIQGLGFSEHPIAGRLVTAIVNRTSDAVVCVSQACRVAFVEFGGNPGTCRELHNGIDLGAFDPSRYPDEHRDEAEPVVAMVAMFDPRKGHDVFVRVAQLVRREHSKARFVIVGDAETNSQKSYMDSVSRLAAELHLGDRLEIRRRVEHAEIPRLLTGVAVNVVPSRTEALPYAAIEAGAMGVPTVATRVGGVGEIVEHGRSGILVEPGDHRSMADAIGRLLADPEQRSAMGRRARERTSRLFDLRRWARSIEELYVELDGSGWEPFPARVPRS